MESWYIDNIFWIKITSIENVFLIGLGMDANSWYCSSVSFVYKSSNYLNLS